MSIGPKGTSAVFVEAIGVAAVWALVAVLMQSQVADQLARHLPLWLAPPRWWWYSPIPWPETILTAALFVALGALFAWSCVRAGISERIVLVGMCSVLVLLWAWAAVDSIGYSREFGVLYWVQVVRVNAPVRLSGTVGSLLGALFAMKVLRRKPAREALPST